MTTQSETYNNSNADGRSRQLRAAGAEESQIADHAKARFESLPSDVQTKLNAKA